MVTLVQAKAKTKAAQPQTHSTVHAASLVSRALHPTPLLYLLDFPVDDVVVAYVQRTILDICNIHHHPFNRSVLARNKPKFTLFNWLQEVIPRSNSTIATVLVALVYLDRMSFASLNRILIGDGTDPFRLFYVALMTAQKCFNDSTMIGKHWSEVSRILTSREILQLEIQFLGALSYDLSVTEDDVYHEAKSMLNAISPSFFDCPASHTISCSTRPAVTNAYPLEPPVEGPNPFGPFSSPFTPILFIASAFPSPPKHTFVDDLNMESSDSSYGGSPVTPMSPSNVHEFYSTMARFKSSPSAQSYTSSSSCSSSCSCADTSPILHSGNNKANYYLEYKSGSPLAVGFTRIAF